MPFVLNNLKIENEGSLEKLKYQVFEWGLRPLLPFQFHIFLYASATMT